MNRDQSSANNLNIKGILTGQNKKYTSLSGRNTLLPDENGYEYVTGIVTEVLSDPRKYFAPQSRRLEILNKIKKEFIESNLIDKIPKNSIICQLIDDGEAEYRPEYTICFPFFPPHISLPVKPTEHVWIIKEVTAGIPRYYWMCRKHSAYLNDKVNLTSHEREIDIYRSSNTKFLRKQNKFNEVNLSLLHSFPQKIKTEGQSSILDPNVIMKNSYAFKNEFTNEPIPDITKKCGDLVLQGSNNAVIHMTTEKFTPVDRQNQRYEKDLFLTNGSLDDHIRSPRAPAIDLVVGRKKNEFNSIEKKLNENAGLPEDFRIVNSDGTNTTFSVVKNSRSAIKSLESYEVNKFQEFSSEDGYDSTSSKDIDPLNCGSRLYLSNNCEIDEIFQLSNTDASLAIFPRYGGSALAGYSEHVRLISAGTLRMVNNFTSEDTTGATYIEINDSGKVSIGSKEGNIESEGGKVGMQPFVRGNDLEVILNEFITATKSAIDIIKLAMESNVSPGFGAPNVPLQLAAEFLGFYLDDDTGSFDLVKNKLPEFKSKLIQGE